eukprot:4246388-Prymnesium_polylepis.1
MRPGLHSCRSLTCARARANALVTRVSTRPLWAEGWGVLVAEIKRAGYVAGLKEAKFSCAEAREA